MMPKQGENCDKCGVSLYDDTGRWDGFAYSEPSKRALVAGFHCHDCHFNYGENAGMREGEEAIRHATRVLEAELENYILAFRKNLRINAVQKAMGYALKDKKPEVMLYLDRELQILLKKAI